MCDSLPVFESCKLFKILKKGIKVTLVSVPVLPSPSPPSTVYRRPLSMMLFGGEGVGTFFNYNFDGCICLTADTLLVHRGSCVLFLHWLNEYFLELLKPSLAWRVTQSFIWLCLIRSRMASWYINKVGTGSNSHDKESPKR